MSDTLGTIPVPGLPSSGETFPLVSDFGYGTVRPFPVVTHRFGELAEKSYQRFQVGVGPRKFGFRRQQISPTDRTSLFAFFESVQGAYQSFTYNAPQADKTTTAYQVLFDQAPLTAQELVHGCQAGITFVEVPSTNPSYSIASTSTRYPSSALATALQSQVQEIIPLLHIQVRQSGYPGIYLSDRRCIVQSQQYLPRLLNMGEPGSDVILSQNISGAADNVQFTLGNADRVLTQLANTTDLQWAEIDLCLYHVQSQILLQLWMGYIVKYQFDGTAKFTLQCSDGFFQVAQSYPNRTISRTCWKNFNDGLNCPFATFGNTLNGGSATSCDYSYGLDQNGNPISGANGCYQHSMTPYFGGVAVSPQGVLIKDNTTGVFGFGRNQVTATSIISDTMWGMAVPDIWCNQGSTALNAFYANAIIADVRDEGNYFDGLGIVGSPIFAFAIAPGNSGELVTNSDGYTYAVSPLLDGFPPQNFSYNIVEGGNSSLKNNNGIGLRQVTGCDPVTANSPLHTITGGSAPSGSYVVVGPIPGGSSIWSVISGLLTLGGTTLLSLIFGGSAAPQMTAGHTVQIADASNGTIYTLTLADEVGQSGSEIQFGTVVYISGSSLWSAQPFQLTGETNYGPYFFSSGIAFVELRYPKQSGIDPTTTEGHSMSVPIAQGRSGWAWDANGNRSDSIAYTGQWTPVNGLIVGMTNPFWIAVNTYLLALGLWNAPSATQLQYFTLSAVVNSAGTGCAQIADTVVLDILGTGYETQLQFQGTIAQRKPLRDWLTEILACALGYFSFDFGKLTLGCRINAVDTLLYPTQANPTGTYVLQPTDAYTVGSMLFQSLKQQPIVPTFEDLTIDFADVAYQYQANTAEYIDKDHAAYYDRTGSPLAKRMHSLGCPTFNQALRLAMVRTREEIGGINRNVSGLNNGNLTNIDPTEWAQSRIVNWQSTILGLTTGIGQITSITHPDLPTSPDAAALSAPANTSYFRVESLKVKKDWSIEMQGRTVYADMYDYTVGPKAPNVASVPNPASLTYAAPLGQWAPYYRQAPSADALFPNEYSFGLSQTALVLADGGQIADLSITAEQTVNTFIAGCGAPVITAGTITQAAGSTNLKAGQILAIAIAGTDGSGHMTPASPVILVTVLADGNSVTINDIQWPPFSGITNWVLFASDHVDLICAQDTGSGTPSSITLGVQTGLPSGASQGLAWRSSWALPNANSQQLLLRVNKVVHAGVVGAPVTAVSGSTITCPNTIDTSNTDNWAGRKLMVIGRPEGEAPYESWNITAFNAATGVFTLDRSAADIEVGDVIIVCFLGGQTQPDAFTVVDIGISNAGNFDPNTGLSTPHSGLVYKDPADPSYNQTIIEDGNILRVIAGKNRGFLATVRLNNATSWKLDQPYTTDATDVWIFEAPNSLYSNPSSTAGTASAETLSQFSVPSANFLEQTLYVTGYTVASDGTVSSDGENPGRLIYLFGSGQAKVINANYTVSPTDQFLACDSSGGAFAITLCPSAQLLHDLTITKISTDSNVITGNCVGSDTINETATSFELVNGPSGGVAGDTIVIAAHP